MSPEVVSDLMREGLFIAMIMVSVIIVPSLVVGLVVSVFQAATQINEMTLTFIPKILEHPSKINGIVLIICIFLRMPASLVLFVLNFNMFFL